MRTSRLLIVSNRLPVTASVTEQGVQLTPAGGGLATGMRPWHEEADGFWIGWPGDTSRFSPAERRDLERQLAERRIAPVMLTSDQVERYYNGFANGVLWPLFHYLIDRVPVNATGWDAYRDVNERFADAIIEEYRGGDVIWIHDYQLMLLPDMLRQRLPDARIGFFLHIPFPSSEVFRILPWRREILRGLLGADLIGFHTFAYMRHFAASLLHIEGVEPDVDRVRVDGRTVTIGAFPMGIDAARLSALADDPGVIAEAERIRAEAGGRHIVLGIDRLDYTKGLPRRLQSVERMLTRHPDLAGRFRYIQLAVPSRDGVDQYQKFKRLVEETVGRINGTHATLGSAPVHYIHQSVSERQLAALYRAADVMLVTPLRDGMNLVAKEYVATRNDQTGTLVLSEFAGASAELCGAQLVNPYDLDAVSDAIARALEMPAEEQKARMRSMRQRVFAYDVHAWAEDFVSRLDANVVDRSSPRPSPPPPALSSALADAARGPGLALLLDYDGTLVPFARAPGLAAPDAELLQLLEDLTAVPGITPELVSGRPRETLDVWFGHLAMPLWAEHGFWHRPAPGLPWQAAVPPDPSWMQRIEDILERFTAATPGSEIEKKTASVAWHFRRAPREFGARQAHELRMLLGDTLSNQPLDVLEGKKVIEVRLRGISKAIVAHRPPTGADPTIAAFGDDRTDEDLFQALPSSSLTVGVGQRLEGARYQVDDYREVRRILRGLASDLQGESTTAVVAERQGSHPEDR